jgi:Ca2+-binding RTX toxin-like protein
MSRGEGLVRRLSLVSLVAAPALIAVAGTASAATTLGQTDPAAPAGYACGSPTAYLQSAVAAGGPSYTVPTGGGVITSWSTQANVNPNKDAELKVFAATSTPGSYLVRGQEGPHILAASVLNSFPAQVPVEAGDILGLYHGTIGTACGFDGVPGDTTSSIFGATPDPPVGSAYTPNMDDTSFRVNISAQLEPDCDKDGLGDESQDTDISSCSPPPQAAATCKGKPATIVGTNGPEVRKGTSGKDVIVGLGGNDKLSGLAGNDVICGGSGKDTLKGGKGKDTLLGQKGKDTLKGGPGKDKLKGGAGRDNQSQ